MIRRPRDLPGTNRPSDPADGPTGPVEVRSQRAPGRELHLPEHGPGEPGRAAADVVGSGPAPETGTAREPASDGPADPVSGPLPDPVSELVSEPVLLARLRAGDPAALDALLARHWSTVFGYALRRTGSREAAEDVAQEVFCRLWERREAWRRTGSVRGLLFRLTRNIAVSAHRRDRAQERAQQVYATSFVESTVSGPIAEQPELRAALESAVRGLPARRREIFLLRMVEGLSYDEIGDVMGISKQTVANQLSRALSTLRLALGHLLD